MTHIRATSASQERPCEQNSAKPLEHGGDSIQQRSGSQCCLHFLKPLSLHTRYRTAKCDRRYAPTAAHEQLEQESYHTTRQEPQTHREAETHVQHIRLLLSRQSCRGCYGGVVRSIVVDVVRRGAIHAPAPMPTLCRRKEGTDSVAFHLKKYVCSSTRDSTSQVSGHTYHLPVESDAIRESSHKRKR